MSSGYRPALIALAVTLAGGVALDAHMRHAGLASLHYERTSIASVLGIAAARATPQSAAAGAATGVSMTPVLLASTGMPLSATTPPGKPRAGKSPPTLLQIDEGPPPVSQAQAREAEQRAAKAHVLRVCSDPNNLPFSDRGGKGFENAIARLVAHDLGRTVRYTWWPQRRGFVRNTLNAGRCDVVMSVPEGYGLVQTTRPYYRSTYVFITRRDRHLAITSLDDPRLAHLTIGVPSTGEGLAPAAQALALRGLIDNTRTYSLLGDYSRPDPTSALIDAVARGEVDIAVDWGPRAGYFAKRASVPLALEPASPPRELPSLAMSFPIAMGVRHGDRALEAELNRTLARRRREIQRVLASYGVPLMGADGRPLRVASRSTG